jgi:hypothetical protein
MSRPADAKTREPDAEQVAVMLASVVGQMNASIESFESRLNNQIGSMQANLEKLERKKDELAGIVAARRAGEIAEIDVRDDLDGVRELRAGLREARESVKSATTLANRRLAELGSAAGTAVVNPP